MDGNHQSYHINFWQYFTLYSHDIFIGDFRFTLILVQGHCDKVLPCSRGGGAESFLSLQCDHRSLRAKSYERVLIGWPQIPRRPTDGWFVAHRGIQAQFRLAQVTRKISTGELHFQPFSTVFPGFSAFLQPRRRRRAAVSILTTRDNLIIPFFDPVEWVSGMDGNETEFCGFGFRLGEGEFDVKPEQISAADLIATWSPTLREFIKGGGGIWRVGGGPLTGPLHSPIPSFCSCLKKASQIAVRISHDFQWVSTNPANYTCQLPTALVKWSQARM